MRPLALLNDSKQVEPEVREVLLRAVLGAATQVSVRVIPACDIDRNGLHRSNLAGLRAVLTDLAPRAERCLVDGFRLGPLAPPHNAVVDGDTKSAAIAAASIVAKVTRDRIMRRLDALYPRYGFSRHVGYITPITRPRCGRTGRASSIGCRMPPSATRRSARRSPSPRRREHGVMNAGERRALWHYRLRGYRIIGTNVRAGRNELDLIVRRGSKLTFVEVKQRRSAGFGGAVGAVDAEKQRRVRRAAQVVALAEPAARLRAGRVRGGRGRGGTAGADSRQPDRELERVGALRQVC